MTNQTAPPDRMGGGAARGAAAAVLPLVSVTSTQIGVALSVPLAYAIGGAGTAALRLAWAGIALLVLTRPRVWTWSWKQIGVCACLGTVTAGMALCYFEAVARLPVGTATAIEFLGPLGVAVAGARRWPEFLWPLLAGAGMILLMGSLEGVGSWTGFAYALAAAGCWAGYILLTRSMASSLPGLQGLAVSVSMAALIGIAVGVVPVSSVIGADDVILAAGIAMLFPLIPYVAEILALRRISVRTFGILMSLDPVVAAIAGFVILDQRLDPFQILGIVSIAAASVGALGGFGFLRPARPSIEERR
ncbi:EamA family transporter [Arenibaculum sp.]|jgi:inner membrane transporter RhtA|uniref:EamA family transporter n=1 Tax=Arenibaculum sp. TaxID=2865862 RepID=UPI002E1136E6|nr:EamA family transporter [Arenibaculum sp.]